ncbi:uncharacterized protein TNCT_163591 [Trichonephila clavata]|uniref:Uncharacterized protein n=1 Tax=Trichonephila clavata TaxID=2740835 RepID=A0A8X6JP73_TRICU|nr:uncharacterized protein TNCT_163591 [Trichonephila clavata]
MIRYLPQEFQPTVQQIYRCKNKEFTAGTIELIIEAKRLQFTKQDLQTVFLSNTETSTKSHAVPDRVDAASGDESGNKWYQKDHGKVFVKHKYVTQIGLLRK